MVRDVLGSLLLLGGALWLWLGLVQAQRRQLRLLEELVTTIPEFSITGLLPAILHTEGINS